VGSGLPNSDVLAEDYLIGTNLTWATILLTGRINGNIDKLFRETARFAFV